MAAGADPARPDRGRPVTVLVLREIQRILVHPERLSMERYIHLLKTREELENKNV